MLLQILGGQLNVKVLKLPKEKLIAIEQIQWNGESLAHSIVGNEIKFTDGRTLDAAHPLVIKLRS